MTFHKALDEDIPQSFGYFIELWMKTFHRALDDIL